ncbi:MAG: hypothetical protein JWR75_1504 [Devosia sp.]|nr:hypothetical protein [Devosia sp.]
MNSSQTNFSQHSIFASNPEPAQGGIGLDPLFRADADMLHLIRARAGLAVNGVEPPSLQATLLGLLGATADTDGVTVETQQLELVDGAATMHVFRPTGKGPLPLVLYWPGGPIADYAETARAITRRSGAIVVALDGIADTEVVGPALWGWVSHYRDALGADPRHIAIAGEGFGAALALQFTLGLEIAGGSQPQHLVLLTPSGLDPAGLDDTPVLARLPATTLILAELDPSITLGETLAATLRRDGVSVDLTIYDGVTEDFFGLGAVVNKAVFAQAQVAANLASAFNPN